MNAPSLTSLPLGAAGLVLSSLLVLAGCDDDDASPPAVPDAAAL